MYAGIFSSPFVWVLYMNTLSLCNSKVTFWHKSNMTDWMFNTVKHGLGILVDRYVTHQSAHFMVAVQRFVQMILKRNWNVYKLLACPLHRESEHTLCKSLLVLCVLPAGPAKRLQQALR
jgi:hypothetical protein